MRLSPAGAHLSYCTNVHPGERWDQVFAALRVDLLAVRERVARDVPFGIGLRLSAQAARSLEQPAELHRFRGWLDAQGLYVFTINGFPHGAFHGARVKEKVYLPDWRDAERLDYTDRLARLLCALLPEGVQGSVSSVPLAFRGALQTPGDWTAAAGRLVQHAATLVRLREQTGRHVTLALEPEPCCALETLTEAAAFFERHLRDDGAARALADATGLSRARAADALCAHLGVCLDACHAAVEFEDAAASVRALRHARVPIAKLQLSSGLRVARDSAAARAALADFVDEVYLHQVVVRRADRRFERHLDLDTALATPVDPDSEWRVHFHVPIFREQLGAFGSTQGFLRELLAMQRAQALSSHLEVETYTWQVLPEALRGASVHDDIALELRWVIDELAGRCKPTR